LRHYESDRRQKVRVNRRNVYGWILGVIERYAQLPEVFHCLESVDLTPGKSVNVEHEDRFKFPAFGIFKETPPFRSALVCTGSSRIDILINAEHSSHFYRLLTDAALGFKAGSVHLVGCGYPRVEHCSSSHDFAPLTRKIPRKSQRHWCSQFRLSGFARPTPSKGWVGRRASGAATRQQRR
jgi:hypothetical protein